MTASTTYIPRSCSVVRDDKAGLQHFEGDAQPKPLVAFRDHASYVLLGAPGAGKTRAFKHEAQETGGIYVTARNFLTFDDLPEWHETTLYIDGLDEQRAGANDQRTALDKVRAKLKAMGQPQFRLSCREADWFGAHDRANLAIIARGRALVVLRLEQFTKAQAHKLLASLDVEDPRQFLADARNYGVDGLAGNPQTLELLARSVADSGRKWPASRTEVFERGCRALARERNDEHQQADRSRPSESAVLDAAGHLSAIWLLTGARGYTETANDGDELLPLGEIEPQQQSLLRATVRTALFDSQGGCFTPCHRHIAEFLGGRYLASCIKEPPWRRVLALLTGFDGGVVSELRGLAAWLSAHSQEGRLELIARDPLGVLLYGDVRGFSKPDKQHLIRMIEELAKHDVTSLTPTYETDARWADLATPDMAKEFSDALHASDHSEAHHAMLVAMLRALTWATTMPAVVPLLRDAVRNEQYAAGTRVPALHAYLKQCDGNDGALALLDDIRMAKFSDPENALLGTLLRHLYPGILPAVKLAEYLPEPDTDGGLLRDFWLYRVPRISTSGQIKELMDALVVSNKIAPVAAPAPQPSLLQQLSSLLLLESLQKGPVDARRVFAWLARIDPYDPTGVVGDIHSWLKKHPEMLKCLHRMSVAEEEEPYALYGVGRRLWAWGLSEGLGPWFAGEAAAAKEERISERFLRLATFHIGAAPDWKDIAQRMYPRVDRLGMLKRYWLDRQSTLKLSTPPVEQPVDKSVKSIRKAWHDRVKAALPELATNCCAPALLHRLALVYFGFMYDIHGETARARLLYLLLDDAALVDAVLDALARTPDRDDLPAERDILLLADKQKAHLLGLPLLAGLEERTEDAVDDATLRLRLTVLYNSTRPLERCLWYRRTVASRPDLAAAVLIESARRDFRRGLKGAVSIALQWLDESDHEAVANLAILSVLSAFPVRAAEGRLPLLATLLRLGIRHHPKKMRTLVQRKLAATSMSVGQRMYWLCAGLLIWRREFATDMRTALTSGDERHARHVAAFFRSRDLHASVSDLAPDTLGVMLRSVGRSFGPVFAGTGSAYIVTGEMDAAYLVRGWIDQLAGVLSEAAAEVIETLVVDPALSGWHRALRHAATTQREQRRNASFKYATMDQVLDTLAGGPPANAADLAALTDDVLAELSYEIRGGSTSDWRQYWKTGLEEPEHEDTCRDRLLSDLGKLLSAYEVQAEPEGSYTNDKRADIKVLGAGAAVPIEIKKSISPDLWTALRGQLMAKYVPDPKADGHGIYLVLWYGEKPPCKLDAEGQRPGSAEELRSRLEAQLTEVESRRIFVRVIDVSNPPRETA